MVDLIQQRRAVAGCDGAAAQDQGGAQGQGLDAAQDQSAAQGGNAGSVYMVIDLSAAGCADAPADEARQGGTTD